MPALPLKQKEIKKIKNVGKQNYNEKDLSVRAVFITRRRRRRILEIILCSNATNLSSLSIAHIANTTRPNSKIVNKTSPKLIITSTEHLFVIFIILIKTHLSSAFYKFIIKILKSKNQDSEKT